MSLNISENVFDMNLKASYHRFVLPKVNARMLHCFEESKSLSAENNLHYFSLVGIHHV